VHRATVYRHYPSRDHLIRDVLSHALREGIEVFSRAAELEASDEAVYCLAADTARFGAQYAFLLGTAELAAAGPDPIELSARMAAWQWSGLLRSDVSAEWLAAAFTALAQALLTPGAITNEQEPHEVLAHMFLRGATREGAVGGWRRLPSWRLLNSRAVEPAPDQTIPPTELHAGRNRRRRLLDPPPLRCSARRRDEPQ
jgi:AcrR family transcriptional regulator